MPQHRAVVHCHRPRGEHWRCVSSHAIRQHHGLRPGIGAAYLVMQFASIMDYVQALFGFFIIPLFGTVIIGMLWRRATPAGGFWGLVSGTASSVLLWLLVKVHPQALAILAFSADAKAMAENLYRFI